MSDDSPNTVINAVIGALVTIVFSFTMISPVLGGVCAGYLQQTDGARVGAFSGVIAAIPAILLALFIMVLFGFGGGPIFLGFFFLMFVLILVPIYIVALSALGGYLGVYLRDEL